VKEELAGKNEQWLFITCLRGVKDVVGWRGPSQPTAARPVQDDGVPALLRVAINAGLNVENGMCGF